MRRVDVKREEGVATTELALVLPVFLLVVIGLLAFGQLLFYWIQTNHVAAETARWAAVDRNPYSGETLQQYAQKNTSQQFSSDPSRVCIWFPDGNKNEGSRLQVKVEKPWGLKFDLPMVEPLKMQITLRGYSTQRIERVAGATGPTAYDDGDYPPSSFPSSPADQCPELP